MLVYFFVCTWVSLFKALNGLALADVPALAFRQPKFINKVY